MQVGCHVSASGSIVKAVDNAVERECTAFQIFYTRDRSYNVDMPAATNLSFNIKLFGF